MHKMACYVRSTEGFALRAECVSSVQMAEDAASERQEAEAGEIVLRSLRQIMRCVSEHSKILARDVGLTLPQLLCLRAIGGAQQHDMTIAKVAAEVQLSPATVSRIVDRLERAGLVSRQRGTQDRRRVKVSLTQNGQLKYDTLPKPLQEIFLARLTALDPHKREQLVSSLRLITAMMDAEDIDAAPILSGESLLYPK